MNHPTDPMTPVRALIEAAGKATPEPWDAGKAQPNNPYVEGGVPALIRHIYHDDKGRRVTEFLMTGNANPTLPTDANMAFVAFARNATASISQLLSEHDKVVEYIKELQEQAAHEIGDYIDVSAEKLAKDNCADRLQSIQEGK